MIGSRALQRDTKDVMDRVENGESMVILRHGRPVAALVPIDREQAEVLALAGSPGFAGRDERIRDSRTVEERTLTVLSEPLQRGEPTLGEGAGEEARVDLMQALESTLQRLRASKQDATELPREIKREILDSVMSTHAESARTLRELSTTLDRERVVLAAAFSDELVTEVAAGKVAQAAATVRPRRTRQRSS